MNRKIKIIIVAISCLLLFSCSSVFQAGLSGTVTDSDSNQAIANVKVFAYTSKSARDADYQTWVDKNDIYSDFNPSKAYIPRATTNENGEFTISKLTWKTYNPEFGKTADYSEVYLLFYKEDYGLSKNIEDNIMIVSDSNNNSNVSQQLTSIYLYRTLNLEIRNAATNNLITDETFDLNVMIMDSSDNELEDFTIKTTITGESTVVLTIPKYKKIKEVAFDDFTVSLEANLSGSTWRQVEKDDEEHYYSSDSPISPISASDLLASDSTYQVDPIYMKNYEFTMPSFSGQIVFKDNKEDDGVYIWLATENSDASKLIIYSETCAEVETESNFDGNSVSHGNFSGLGQGPEKIIWEPILDEDGDYEGQYGTITLYFIIDNVDGTSDEKYTPDVNDKFYRYELKSTGEASKSLPTIKYDNIQTISESESIEWD
ncbi:MAG: carboxypeptidase-like regulatory domain-containing protein [Sphaerochaetaceae bacterium]